jgi:hypothetical protein
MHIDWDTYTFLPDIKTLSNQVWHPGDTVPARWEAEVDGMRGEPVGAEGDGKIGNNAVPVTLTMQILGPLSAVDKANLSIDGFVLIASYQSIVNDQTGLVEPGTMQLPLSLSHGSYGVSASLEKAGYSPITVVEVIEVVK